MVRSFGVPEPPPPMPAPMQIPALLVPQLDAHEMARIAAQIQRAVYEAVRAGFQQATDELAGEDDDAAP